MIMYLLLHCVVLLAHCRPQGYSALYDRKHQQVTLRRVARNMTGKIQSHNQDDVTYI